MDPVDLVALLVLVLPNQVLFQVLERLKVGIAVVYGDDALNYWMLDSWLILVMACAEYYVNYATKNDYENYEKKWLTVYHDAMLWLDALQMSDDAQR